MYANPCYLILVLQLLKFILAALFVTTWMATSNHCYLERAGLLPEDECHETQPPAPAEGDPCETGCKVVEESIGKTTTPHKISLPSAPLVLLHIQIAPEPAPCLSEQSPRLSAWPPDTLSLPQFVLSTALPARAPSIAS